jgi:hypothetical protein
VHAEPVTDMFTCVFCTNLILIKRPIQLISPGVKARIQETASDWIMCLCLI